MIARVAAIFFASLLLIVVLSTQAKDPQQSNKSVTTDTQPVTSTKTRPTATANTQPSTQQTHPKQAQTANAQKPIAQQKQPAQTSQSKKPAAPPKDGMPAFVNTDQVNASTWQSTFQATGTLGAFNGVMINPEVAGQVTKILFQSGRFVQANTPLVILNQDIIKTQISKAKSQLQLDKLSYWRAKKTLPSGAIPKADFDKAKATYQQAKADLNNLKATLAQTVVRAPFAGTLGLRQVNIGDYVEPGNAIVSLQALSPLYVDYAIPASKLSAVKVGQRVIMTSPSFPGKKFQGSVYALNSIINDKTRTLMVRATIPNANNVLLPGSFVQVTQYLGTPKKVITVPETAVSYDLNGPYVYRYQNKRAVKTHIKLGLRQTDSIIVLDGLKPGETIISVGELKIHPGAHVIVLPSHPTKTAHS